MSPVRNRRYRWSIRSERFDIPISHNATSAIDYRASIASGSKLATGNGANNVAALSTITTVGNVQTLTIGVNVQFTFSLINSGDTIVNVVGQIVATNSPSVAAPVVLQSPTVTNQVVTLQWQSPPGQNYQVLSSSNLATWQTNAQNVTSVSTLHLDHHESGTESILSSRALRAAGAPKQD